MQRYKMPARYLHDLISGAEMDLTIQTYPTFDRLREYCYRVAGTLDSLAHMCSASAMPVPGLG